MIETFRAAALMAVMVLSGSAANASPQQTSTTGDASHAGAVAEPAAAQASVPRLVQFNGTLKDSAARLVVGVASVTFEIYSEQDGGTALWSETQNVIADANGHFSALLGGATANGMPAELFGTGQARWLGITVARQSEMPRVLLASVPYALKAQDAATLGGLPASAYVTTQALAASNARASTAVGGGNTTIIATPQVGTGQTAVAATPSAAEASPQATPSGTGTSDFIPIWTSSSALGNSLLFQTGGRLGFGTTTPAATFDLNGGEILRGGFYEYPQGTATASTGQPSHSFQWLASVFNSSTKKPVDYAFGFRALPQSNNTSNPAAKLDLFYGTGGPDGSTSDLGLSISNTGVITFVPGQNFNGASETLTGALNLPDTTTPTNGVLTLGGVPFINDYGDSSSMYIGKYAGGAFAANGTSYNTGVGYDALYYITSGSDNSAFGYDALENNTSGYNNTAVGFQAGGNYGTGSSNTFLGANADANVTGLVEATAIGANATIGGSHAMALGGQGGDAVNVGIGTATPTHTLEVIDRGTSNAAIYSTSAVTGNSAVLGISTAASGSGSNGAYFYSSSPAGSGVVGVNEYGGYGGYFIGNTYAAYFSGNVGISGTLTKGAGSFKIDDPIDPANKYLSHSFVESPDMMNIYNGNVVTDAKGYATVAMPKWFEALNGDFRYQLTTMNSFARATVAQEIHDGKFRIRTSRPNVKVSWQVTGIRHDAYAEAHRIPTEEVKPADEQGHYLHPELFGAGAEKSIAARQAPPPVTAVK